MTHPSISDENAPKTADEALREAYWVLRGHAAAYRAVPAIKRHRDDWEADGRRDAEVGRQVAIHEFYARGLEAAARRIADLLGVPEHEIEEPTAAPPETAMSGPTDQGARVSEISAEEKVRRAIGSALLRASNDLDVDDLTQWHPCEPTCGKCACSGIPYVSDALWEQLKPILSGRLLPSGGEPETQWGVRYVNVDPGPAHPPFVQIYRDEKQARAYAATDWDTIRAELVCRQVGPWSPVVPDNSTKEPA